MYATRGILPITYGQSLNIEREIPKSVAVIVAHPDDETLWAGGTILSNPSWKCFVLCLSRRSDPERASRFSQALGALKSVGAMADLNDGPEQKPLDEREVEHAILDLLPSRHYDLIISHNPSGEYTKHLRHEEAGAAVITLWHAGRISADELWTFAYEDGNKKYYPRPIEQAAIYRKLEENIWLEKYGIMTSTYGYEKNSWEAQTTPKAESFWRFTDPNDAKRWLDKKGVLT